MSEPTRAERRRHQRGDSAPPPKPDPMRPVYIGVGILMLVVVAAFGAFRWQQNHALAVAFATPSPGPTPTSKPIQLADGVALGTPYFKGRFPDTKSGGQGEPIDQIKCLGMEGQNLHIHTHLALIVNGKVLQIPQLIGFAQNPALPGGGCLYWIHTHDASGIIHIESPEIQAPQTGGRYTLGMLFDIWGQPLGPDGVAGFKGPVTAYVNGSKYDGDLHAIPLMSHQQIVLEVGTPVPPPNYAFPPND